MDASYVSTARRRAELRNPTSPIAVASAYLHALDDLDPCPAVVLGRVSSTVQGRNENLNHQSANLVAEVDARSFDVLRTFGEIGPGWRTGPKFDRPVLSAAVAFARAHGAVLVAESTDRFLRSVDYAGQTCPGALPTVYDFEQLMEVAGDVPLATLLDPDTPWEDVRGYQSQRGQVGRGGQRGGRPRTTLPGDKKRVRERWRDAVIRFHRLGYTLSEISGLTDDEVPKATVHRWIITSD